MIQILDKNLFDSKANFIVHQTNCDGIMGSGVALQIAKRFPHVETEYNKYLRYLRKNHINPLGTVQYVPTEVWALTMIDTMRNKDVSPYDTDYQYIVNLFGQNSIGTGQQTDLNAMKTAFTDIRRKADQIGASIAMPYQIGSKRGGAAWTDVYAIIEEVFKDCEQNVEICRYDLG